MATIKKRDTYLQAIIKQGYSRRDFMKFTTFMAAYMGLQNSAIGKITVLKLTSSKSAIRKISLRKITIIECTVCERL